ncbi:MAG TPA: hypothetical protein VMK12_05505 [Anaeromyxobacteraceae bacterium]|nr:hypothetical protein [Anaeromyxobacteraceae bacterium]
MPVELAKKTWLADLIDTTLQGYDPTVALLRLPTELRGADPDGPSLEGRARALLVRSLHRKLLNPAQRKSEDIFLSPLEGHVCLALDIALVHGSPFDARIRRAELAIFFGSLIGAFDLVRTIDPRRALDGAVVPVQRALVRAGIFLKATGYPPGDPRDGLPLRAGLLCIQRRQLARLAISYYGDGRLSVEIARKLFAQARLDALLLVEALAAIAAAGGPADARRRRIILSQVAHLGLGRDLARRARAAVQSPRGPIDLALATPDRLRAFLLEQLLLSEVASAQSSPSRADFVRAFAGAAEIPPEKVAALHSDAGLLCADQQHWLESSPAEEEDWVKEWNGVTDHLMDRVASLVTDNLEAIVTEFKKTGELGELLAKAAAGHGLSPEEKIKVKSQLLDLAKAVPALALFAAPGGMLLLPLLAKLLPFSVLPSAWNGKRKAGRSRLLSG